MVEEDGVELDSDEPGSLLLIGSDDEPGTEDEPGALEEPGTLLEPGVEELPGVLDEPGMLLDVLLEELLLFELEVLEILEEELLKEDVKESLLVSLAVSDEGLFLETGPIEIKSQPVINNANNGIKAIFFFIFLSS